jgi:pyruvate/2-oxoglutarate dehydrogenase complex dihydrolipoamide dehydrogenase (E3) component/uncharacterized membrane protein YdjX (TVP38/TMEM64 family)
MIMKRKFIVIAFIGVLILLFFVFDLKQYLTLGYFKSQQQAFEAYYSAHTGLTIAIYMFVYILVTALSLPGATVMTLAGAAIFGLWIGLLAVSFASTIGATLAFLTSRFLLRDYIQNKFSDRLESVNDGIRKDGAFYLFTLRLLPIVPFFVINLVMGLTPIRTIMFYLVSQIGMLPGTFVYVNAGTQLAKITSVQGIFSPGLIASFALLGIFPLIANSAVRVIKDRKILAKYPKPQKFDYNLVVIGAGSAGLVSAYIAAAVRAKVALIEKHKMGGDCLNTGCVPSKALIRSAKMLSYAARAKEFGFRQGHIEYDFAEVMERVQNIIKKVEPHDSVERYTALGVDCISGEAKITSPYTVDVNGKTLCTRNIVIATGASPFIPPIPGLNQVKYLTSDTVWNIRKLPKRFVILGGGPIGCELAQAFARFGSDVIQIQSGHRIMAREDVEISEMMKQKFESEGIRVLTNHRAKEVIIRDSRKILVCEHQGHTADIEFDDILVAVGRAAITKGFGMEELGVELRRNNTIQTNEFLQTNFPNIFCAGDVTSPYQFTHTAAHQAWYASVNALFRGIKSFKADYRVIPRSTFTDPEIARVGLNELEAKEKAIAYEVTKYGLDDLDRAIADSEDHGMVKVLTRPRSDKILGVTIAGAHAGDLIAEFVLAMKHGLGLNKILGTIHIYPTLAEANKYAAGAWKKAHTPENILRWLARYHAWMRG